jgi:ribonuclease HI
MTKARFEKALSFLNDCFAGDDEAEEALGILRLKGDALAWTAPKEQNSHDLPLPDEVKGQDDRFALFSDGACRGNPGPGAWASIAQNSAGEMIFQSSGVESHTTNNRMELEGAIAALVQLDESLGGLSLSAKAQVYVYSDSRYVVDGMNQWVPGWKSRDWRKADNKVPENVDLWKRLDEASTLFWEVQFRWVKGHRGHPQNELCDRLCNQALDEAGF